MIDDIVTRLRETPYDPEKGYFACYDDLILEAADEIERLRAEIRALEAKRNQWQRQALNDD